jgi:hypothetical protein
MPPKHFFEVGGNEFRATVGDFYAQTTGFVCSGRIKHRYLGTSKITGAGASTIKTYQSRAQPGSDEARHDLSSNKSKVALSFFWPNHWHSP